MRVLFLTSRFPGDLRTGDRRRAYEQLLRLSNDHAITLLTFADEGNDTAVRARIFAACERVILVPRDPIAMAWRLIRAAFGSIPMQVALYAAPALRRALTDACATRRFDVLHVQLARMGTFVTSDGAPCILDFVDALSLNMAQRARFDRGPLGLIAQVEAKRLRSYERDLAARVSRGAVTTRLDHDALGKPDNVELVDNGVDLEEFPFVDGGRDATTIVFVGNLSYFPNVDAARWFATQMPRVRTAFAGAELHLIGARPTASLRRLAARVEGVKLIGPVENVHTRLARAALAVAPMRAGSGQQIKILEAMATGTPVVATSSAAAAIDARDGIELLIADRPDDFAAAVIRLLVDRPFAVSLAKAARALIERRYTWSASAKALEGLWIEAANAPR
jgi:polysaccharide biosynthesis protein PslH